MIDVEAHRELETLEPGQGPHAMVLEWTDSVLASPRDQEGPRRARLEALERLLREHKRPLLDRLAAIEGVEVQDLRALPQAIVRADPAAWARLTQAGGVLDREPGVRLIPSHFYRALSPQA